MCFNVVRGSPNGLATEGKIAPRGLLRRNSDYPPPRCDGTLIASDSRLQSPRRCFNLKITIGEVRKIELTIVTIYSN
jgi:hypothetical protein